MADDAEDRYAKMSQEDFDSILLEILKEQSATSLIGIPGVYSAVSEEFNNEVLERWEAAIEIGKR